MEKNTSDGRRSNKFEFEKTVHMTLVDHSRTQCNIVVTGLSESVVEDEDSGAFTEICETHLSIKPNIVHNREIIRLGKATGNKPRRLLVKLKAEDIANSILRASTNLRKSDDDFVKDNIYINRDLTPAEQKLAFEQRCKRRAKLNSDVELTNAHPGRGATAAGRSVSCAIRVSLLSSKSNKKGRHVSSEKTTRLDKKPVISRAIGEASISKKTNNEYRPLSLRVQPALIINLTSDK